MKKNVCVERDSYHLRVVHDPERQPQERLSYTNLKVIYEDGSFRAAQSVLYCIPINSVYKKFAPPLDNFVFYCLTPLNQRRLSCGFLMPFNRKK